jgi:hypothetical protein
VETPAGALFRVAEMGRILPLVPVTTSLVAFISEVTNKGGWWVYSLDRASYVLIVFAVIAALLSERRANVLALGAQLAAVVTAVAFMAVALVKFYGATPAFGLDYQAAQPWANEAQLFALAALAFGLTLARRRTMALPGLFAAIAAAFGCAIYAITQEATYTAETWWTIATVGAFLAAAAAATLERDGVVTLGAPVAGGAGGDPGSDPGVE